jgi:hypothetical protein
MSNNAAPYKGHTVCADFNVNEKYAPGLSNAVLEISSPISYHDE